MNFGNWFGQQGVPGLQGLSMPNSGLNGNVGTSLAGMNVSSGFSLPTGTGPDYMGLLGAVSGMMPSEEPQAQPMQAPQMAMPQANQEAAQQGFGPLYQPMMYRHQPTAGYLNSLLGGVYGNS